jgi:DNA-binding response OmpR family regulator
VSEDADDEVEAVGSGAGGITRRRRAEPRVAATFRVRYESLDELVVAYTEDVSRGGLYVRTDRFLPVGAVARIHIELPPEEGASTPELSAIARVAYVLDPARACDHEREPGMGMEFLDVGGQPLADEIARFIAQAAPEAALPPSPAGMSSLVLVIDDDAWYREHAAELMREAGHNVVTAENGVKGLAQALKAEPDLILTDVQMPIMDGWQLVRMLRARPTLAQIPVVFVTALSSDEQRLQGYRLGVDDYIAKPFNDDELGLRIQRVLDRSRAYPRNVAGNKALRGDLSQISLASLLGFLDSEKRTGLLLLVRPNEVATLFVRGGQVVRIDMREEAAKLTGHEKLYALLGWDWGRFELAEAEVEDEDVIRLSTVEALLEWARRQEPPGA